MPHLACFPHGHPLLLLSCEMPPGQQPPSLLRGQFLSNEEARPDGSCSPATWLGSLPPSPILQGLVAKEAFSLATTSSGALDPQSPAHGRPPSGPAALRPGC